MKLKASFDWSMAIHMLVTDPYIGWYTFVHDRVEITKLTELESHCRICIPQGWKFIVTNLEEIYGIYISFVELTAYELIIWHRGNNLAIQMSWSCARDWTRNISREGLEPEEFTITNQMISCYESKTIR